ncbi:MAG: bifunctional folylpolyglutamate synthase/dihydrofolate synthase [Synergistes sp.]|nr:bifunctional folylpolyglutamate synthase/dihydrofolate synthase [Synergistes sp.]
MNEKEAFAEIERKLQDMASPGIRPGLARLARLLYEAGMPQRGIPVVHIAGTNGKGSVAASLYSILLSSGYSAFLYTSPHLEDFSERLLYNGQRVTASKWQNATDKIEKIINGTEYFKNGDLPTYFELTTAAAIMIVSEERPDIAVFETGMGGRLDATNIFKDVRLSIITPIGLDHTEYLGDSIEKIADEKFAIMRKGRPVLFAGDKILNERFYDAASRSGALPLIFSLDHKITGVSYSLAGSDFTLSGPSFGENRYHTPLVGTFQPENVSLAAAAANILKKDFPKITQGTIHSGISSVIWPGRMEVISQKFPFLLDGGHNPHAMRRIAQTIRALLPGRRVNVVTAMMKDKETGRALSYLRDTGAVLYCTEVPDFPRSLKADEMAEIAKNEGFEVMGSFNDPIDAINAALGEGLPLLCCGSLFLVGYVKEHINELYGL